jgi:LysM repeat protein
MECRIVSIMAMLPRKGCSGIMLLFDASKPNPEKPIVKCPNCGASFRGGRGRCPACGYRVQVKTLVRRCPECRARVAEAAKTCLMCGATLEGERGFLPRVSLSMVPPAPLLGGILGVLLVIAVWFTKPWRLVQLGTYHTPTPTATLTTTPTITGTPTSTPTVPPTGTPTPEVTTYIVRPGDTLSTIAAQFDVTVEALMEANGLTNHMIQVGQELIIPVEGGGPGGSPEVGETPGSEATTQPETVTYVVQAGDSLSEIARRFNVTIEAVMEANGITDPDSIREGQELLIPGAVSLSETPGIGGAPTPTVESLLVHPAPLLLGPPDRREFSEEQAELPILLNWLSVGLLAEEEWYSVILRYIDPEEEQEREIVEFTKANSYHVSADLRPPLEAESHVFEWQVRVVRLIEAEIEGSPEIVPVGRFSDPCTFLWY